VVLGNSIVLIKQMRAASRFDGLSLTIYQLRLMLAGVSPMIWRRLLVSSGTNIVQLHEYIQIAFDWTAEHLHRFHLDGKDYGIAYRGVSPWMTTSARCCSPASVCTHEKRFATSMTSPPGGA
jgi:hypothetical protein